MISIGLICEGVSEINVMTRIISKYLGDEVFVNPIEPETKMENGALVQNGYGGWQQVLNHCNDETIERILEYNDYLVIQIDTDTSILIGYDVKQMDDDGQQKTVEVFYQDVKNRLLKNISPEVQKKYEGRIIFAICMNEIECWLLPLYYSDNNRCKMNNCIYTLNQALGRKNIGGIPETDKNSPSARNVYNKILKNLKNKKSIQDCAKYHYGFNELTKQLDKLELK
jgi:hypothetical protein